MANPQTQQALQRLNYNCQPPEARRPLSMADYAEAHAALRVIEQAVAQLGELEAKLAARPPAEIQASGSGADGKTA